VTKIKTAYPPDEALKKIIYLATMDVSKKWDMPLGDWKQCISQFSIYFSDRLKTELAR
jgi:transposase-like protein